ncbi:GATA zinc finger domain-containing protein [Mycena kentingensis (nom. inval.)]|nr:GATA zinc finger domain-containing protein [Mycena kentingensis (nom. inval.)]
MPTTHAMYTPPSLLDRNEEVGHSTLLRSYWADETLSASSSPYSSMSSPLPPVVGLPPLVNRRASAGYSSPMPPRSHSSASNASPILDFTGLITMHEANPNVSGRALVEEHHYRSGADDWMSSPRGSFDQGHAHRMWSLPTPSRQDQAWSSASAPYGAYSRRSPTSPYSTPSDTTSPSAYFLSPLSTTGSLPLPSLPSLPPRRAAVPPAKKECFHCHATTTPLWRREPTTQRPLCNACGLYLQQRNKLRPQELIDADRDDPDDEINRIPDAEYTGPKCSHCGTRQTSVWRRSKTGQQVCNACGVYARLKGKERPLSLRRNKIKPRSSHKR